MGRGSVFDCGVWIVSVGNEKGLGTESEWVVWCLSVCVVSLDYFCR